MRSSVDARRLRPVAIAALLPVLLLLVSSACAPSPDGRPASRSLVLAHFVPPLSTVRSGVVIPFSERLAQVSGGRLTATEYMGGALGSDPRRYYSMLLAGVADIAFVIPGYTAATFPRTTLSAYPGVCGSAIECTAALRRAGPALENEYQTKVLAMWSTTPPVLLTRERPVRRLEDLQGLKLRVSSRIEMPFIEALGATPVMQPVSEIQQNLHTGVIDGVVITAGGISAYQLQEPAEYLTTWLPLSATPFSLLMNRGAYESLSAQEQSWLDEAADAWLSESGGQAYELAGARGLRIARDAGVELIDLSDEEKARFLEAVADVYQAQLSRRIGDATVAEIIDLFRGN